MSADWRVQTACQRCGRKVSIDATLIFVKTREGVLIACCWHCWHLPEEDWPTGMGAIKRQAT